MYNLRTCNTKISIPLLLSERNQLSKSPYIDQNKLCLTLNCNILYFFTLNFKGESTPYIKWVHKRSINITTTPGSNETNSNTTTTTTANPSKYSRYGERARAEASVIVPKINSITYTKDDVRYIVTDLKYEQTASSTLVLKDLRLADSGIYTCVMSNLKGVARKSTYLTVNPGRKIYFLYCWVKRERK